ncbi:hypothetical protein DFAR_1460002 [Desulfarculales bacterium]
MAQALSKMDLGGVKAVALNETASKRGHNYITVFIDLDRKQKPVIIVTPGKGKGCLVLFRRFLREHGGDYNNNRRGGLRHVNSLPGRHRQKLPQRQRHRALVPYSPNSSPLPWKRSERPRRKSVNCPWSPAGPCSRPLSAAG